MNPIEALTAQLMPHLMLAPIALPLLTAALMLLLREEQQRLKVSLNLPTVNGLGSTSSDAPNFRAATTPAPNFISP